MKIYSRKEWGAKYRAGFGSRSVGNLKRYQHHSVSRTRGEKATLQQDFEDMRLLESIGNTRFKGGISYTFAVFPSGRVMEGTGVARIGAHTAGHNTTAAGIVLVGNYQNMKPTAKQIRAQAKLLSHGVQKKWWKSPTFTGAHKEVKATACSGKYAIAAIPQVDALGKKYLKQAQALTVVKPKPKPNPAILAKGSKGSRVRKLQDGFNNVFPTYANSVSVNKGRRLVEDGIYGDATVAWVKEFQRRTGLPVTGKVDAATKAKLNKFGINF